jgi:hypothetical protein
MEVKKLKFTRNFKNLQEFRVFELLHEFWSFKIKILDDFGSLQDVM